MGLAPSPRVALGVAVTAFAALLLAAGPAVASTLPAGFGEKTLVDGLQNPTAVAWAPAPDGRMFVADKFGHVFAVQPGSTDPTQILDITDHVNAYGDRGLLGMAVDPDFAGTHPYLYLLYVYDGDPANPSGQKHSRLSRFDLSKPNPSSTEKVLDGAYNLTAACPTQDNTVDCIPADATLHSIGTVRADTDGTLWFGSGDSTANAVDETRGRRTSDVQSFAGKIMHVDRNGNGLSSHPFCPTDTDLTHVCTKIYAKGFRNPFRFTLRPGKGPAVGDVGNNTWEELDLAKPGQDYGWPCYEADTRTPGYADTNYCANEVYPLEGTSQAKSAPSWSYPHAGTGAAILPGPIYNGNGYPAGYQGQLFIGDYAKSFLKTASIDSSDHVTSVQDFGTDWTAGGGVDIETAPDGNLVYVDIGYFGPDSGLVQELTYTPGNSAPLARGTANPTSGARPLSVQFHGDGSSDPDGNPITYDWNFGDGSAHSTAANPSHTYNPAADGPYTAKLTVTDSHGSSSIARVPIQVGRPPDAVTISSPTDGSTYQGGQQIQLQGSAHDPDDGTLSGSSLKWHVVLHHGDHLHDLGTFSGNGASFATYTDHGADSHYDISLTAKDSSGLTSGSKVSIYPQTVNLAINSVPPGAPISFYGTAATAPFTTLAAVGSKPTVSAADSFVVGGRTYRFLSWSDSGARVHDITLPATSTTLQVNYRADPLPKAPAAATPPTSPAPVSSSGSTIDSTHIELSRRSLRLGSHRQVRVWIQCIRHDGSCRGALAIHSIGATKSGQPGRAKYATYGSGRFRLGAGLRGVVKIRLSRRAARLLLARGHMRVQLAAVTSDLNGHRRRTSRVLLLSG